MQKKAVILQRIYFKEFCLCITGREKKIVHHRLKCSLNPMAEKVLQAPECLLFHAAVRMEDCIAVFMSHEYAHEFWKYNLWTEQWRKCPIKRHLQFPRTEYLRGAAIRSVVYMFGGGPTPSNTLWKLIQNSDGSFGWKTILMENKKMPSPRIDHCGWENGDKLWIFGGYGKSPVGYMNDHGDFAGNLPRWDGMCGNNQLFSYDPLMQSWKNMACYGDVPSPQGSHIVATSKEKVWLYGGYSGAPGAVCKNKLYELNMESLVWTHIRTSIQISKSFRTSSLTPLSQNRLVIDGCSSEGRSTWIFDVESDRLRQFPASAKCYCFLFPATGTSGLNGDVIILGGHKTPCNKRDFSVMLEPKSLQQFAMRIIYKYEKDLPWKNLPLMLIRRLFGTETE